MDIDFEAKILKIHTMDQLPLLDSTKGIDFYIRKNKRGIKNIPGPIEIKGGKLFINFSNLFFKIFLIILFKMPIISISH